MSLPLPTALAPTPLDTRLHSFDHLRALAMLVGVLFHAALAYSPLLQPFWPSADRQSWWGIDAVIWLPHLLRMPVFFLVAGYFSADLLARRGMTGLMRQRLQRILLPLLVALPLLHIGMLELTRWAATTVEHRSGLLELVHAWMAMPDPPPAPLGTGHLWFLYYLLLFSVLHWVGRTLELGALFERMRAAGPRALALLLPIVLLPGFALSPAPHPAPESLLPQFWAIGIFGPFFAFGVALHGRLHWLQSLRSWLLPGVLACLLLYAVFCGWLSVELDVAATTTPPWSIVMAQGCVAAWGTLGCVVAAATWFDRPSPVLRYLATSAYWTYLLHLPLLLFIQYALMDLDLHWIWKLLVAIATTMIVCLLSYEVLVRRTPLRRFVG